MSTRRVVPEPMYPEDNDPARGYEDRIVERLARGAVPREQTTLGRYRQLKAQSRRPGVQQAAPMDALEGTRLARGRTQQENPAESAVAAVDFDVDVVRMTPPEEAARFADGEDGCVDTRRVAVFYHERNNAEYVEFSAATNQDLWLDEATKDTVWVCRRDEVKALRADSTMWYWVIVAVVAGLAMARFAMLAATSLTAVWGMMFALGVMAFASAHAVRRIGIVHYVPHAWVRLTSHEWRTTMRQMTQMVSTGYTLAEIESWLDTKLYGA